MRLFKFLSDVIVFDPQTDTWSELKCEGEAPGPRAWMDWACYDSESILLVGGLNEDVTRLNEIYLLHISE